MDANQATWDSLRAKGYSIDDVYVQAGAGSTSGQMYVVINGVAMPFDDARALERGAATIDEIAGRRSS